MFSDLSFGNFLPVIPDELFDASDHLVGFLSRLHEYLTLTGASALIQDPFKLHP
jgi:hypothetical protein